MSQVCMTIAIFVGVVALTELGLAIPAAIFGPFTARGLVTTAVIGLVFAACFLALAWIINHWLELTDV